ncbi:4'-phosphopantetheinyl transferase [Gilbertella persicaria]|uniref:4'-phosphopantetheinyl transferase n=1 Tax=Gilbertella persicaria TaxID=101096 RepID=UPI002220EF2F|nr:4'-phosphopantetheinyl transferase [Gilbertella persicaria]KAI8069841.1 4'-phosphopantetheinyl transferase [Gilbertella persicaria]
MIIGIGVDIMHLPRITALVARRGHDKLARRILSQKEYLEFKSLQALNQQKRDAYLSARWCIKEAVYKALYPKHRLEWKQVTYINRATHGQKGKPELEILNSQLYGIQNAHVSLSHDGEYAIAQVVLEG